ncbi:6-carboxy-5,6,7,8-tetrahydropterin synthase [bacterium HR20]|jgi:6-pyruvoyltetrahydropterin/6-carboxytetrahydropterin synthase|nr:6-carboxy-5,6,7,8-tetrahydropterin synthase [bacterium HR20]
MVYITRRATFSASHRLHNPLLSDADNERIYDKCNNPRGHGHNYVLEVTVRGVPDPTTGYVLDLKLLRDIIEEHIIAKVDHRHLNEDVDFLRGIIPTAENLAWAFWRILEPHIPAGTLHSIKVYESENNFVEYRGEPMEVPRYCVEHIEHVQ